MRDYKAAYYADRAINTDFTKLAINEECVYHKGNIAMERKKDGRLDRLATRALQMSEAIFDFTLHADDSKSVDRVVMGTGELVLYQVPIDGEYQYAYCARRIRPRVVGT